MKRIITILALLVPLTLSAKGSGADGMFTAAYIHYSSVTPGFDLEGISKPDRILFFGLSPDADGVFTVDEKYLKALETVRAHVRREQEFILVVGGGAKVANMHVMGDDPAKRAAYAKELVKFARKWKFDGIDMDWETNWKVKPHKDVDTEALRDLLSRIRKGMPKKALLTAAIGSSAHSVQQAKDILDLVDDISVMIYSGLNKEGLHAPLYTVKGRMAPFAAAGIPNDRLLVGVPFYGIRKGADGKKETKVYSGILPMIPEGDTSSGIIDGYSFNCVDEMKAKRDWVVENGYKGIMIWQIGQDAPYSDPRSLLRTLVEYTPDRNK